jgi:hypothetical protein
LRQNFAHPEHSHLAERKKNERKFSHPWHMSEIMVGGIIPIKQQHSPATAPLLSYERLLSDSCRYAFTVVYCYVTQHLKRYTNLGTDVGVSETILPL